MKRVPAVAHRFYPGDKKALNHAVQELFGELTHKKQEAIGVMSPHAGYIYSGSVAAETLGSVHIPKTVIIIGPNHQGQGASVALSCSTWQMPMGDVLIDQHFSKKLMQNCSLIEEDDTAHKFEHSLEVQVPFLQALQEDLAIVPIVVSHLPYSHCKQVAEALAKTIEEHSSDVLILASSDMSHYETRQSASKKDHLALERLLDMDVEGIYKTVKEHQISMCGIIPVTIMLQAAILLGANTTKLVRYTDSGEVSGDIDQVVGYAGAVISKI